MFPPEDDDDASQEMVTRPSPALAVTPDGAVMTGTAAVATFPVMIPIEKVTDIKTTGIFREFNIRPSSPKEFFQLLVLQNLLRKKKSVKFNTPNFNNERNDKLN
jgi:hypothetical protein